jgi:hypothetical protein
MVDGDWGGIAKVRSASGSREMVWENMFDSCVDYAMAAIALFSS